MINLNEEKILSSDGPNEPLLDYSCQSCCGNISVYFKNIETALIKHIDDSDAIVGCVAWLTNQRILTRLSKKKSVSIIVQKEDFLRPDIDNSSGWKRKLQAMYSMVHSDFSRNSDIFNGTAIHGLSFGGSGDIAAIRCVGNYNSDKSSTQPRAHHKFLVFLRENKLDHVIEPYGVWTGSFNFTSNATMSLENAIYLTDKNIVMAFFQEWSQVAAISESLNWTSKWVSPEWKIGT